MDGLQGHLGKSVLGFDAPLGQRNRKEAGDLQLECTAAIGQRHAADEGVQVIAVGYAELPSDTMMQLPCWLGIESVARCESTCPGLADIPVS